MEEIQEDIQSYIDIIKGHIEEQKKLRKTLKGSKIDESISYTIGMEVGLACLQNIQFKIKNKIKESRVAQT